MGDSRIICPAWRANTIVQIPPARRKWKKKKVDPTAQAEMSACHGRCELEYFGTNKVMIACTLLTESIRN